MANPSLEDGHIPIASDLFTAFIRFGFTSLERRVLDAVMFMTYGANKKSSEMTVYDIRLLLGATANIRTDRLEDTITALVEKNVLFRQQYQNGTTVIGMQKDYDQWGTLFGKSLSEASSSAPTDKMCSNTCSPSRVNSPVLVLIP